MSASVRLLLTLLLIATAPTASAQEPPTPAPPTATDDFDEGLDDTPQKSTPKPTPAKAPKTAAADAHDTHDTNRVWPAIAVGAVACTAGVGTAAAACTFPSTICAACAAPVVVGATAGATSLGTSLMEGVPLDRGLWAIGAATAGTTLGAGAAALAGLAWATQRHSTVSAVARAQGETVHPLVADAIEREGLYLAAACLGVSGLVIGAASMFLLPASLPKSVVQPAPPTPKRASRAESAPARSVVAHTASMAF